jgi:hypothetical protein
MLPTMFSPLRVIAVKVFPHLYCRGIFSCLHLHLRPPPDSVADKGQCCPRLCVWPGIGSNVLPVLLLAKSSHVHCRRYAFIFISGRRPTDEGARAGAPISAQLEIGAARTRRGSK